MYVTCLCSCLDLLIREETLVQILSALLVECDSRSQNQVFALNLKLACQSKGGLILNQSQAVWFGVHSGGYDKQTTAGLRVLKDTFLMFKALIPAPFWADQVLVSRVRARLNSPLSWRTWTPVQSLLCQRSPSGGVFEPLWMGSTFSKRVLRRNCKSTVLDNNKLNFINGFIVQWNAK